jgi:ABC-type sugar transport system ATPase subunit
VALGRAIARQPRAFLFDEPLSNLDPRLRGDTRTELVDLHRRLGATMIYVTHDQEEAMTLGQRVAVLRDGRLEQVGRPLELYHQPANVFVAGFIGSPPMNLLAATPAASLAHGVGVAAPPAGGHLGVRPWDLPIVTTGVDAPLAGTVELIEPLGHAVVVHLSLENGIRLTSVAPPGTVVHLGDRVGITATADCVHVFDAMGRRRSDP